jgi:hypothetical protein
MITNLPKKKKKKKKKVAHARGFISHHERSRNWPQWPYTQKNLMIACLYGTRSHYVYSAYNTHTNARFKILQHSIIDCLLFV